ncbi:mannitol 1-phosphate dehydrogenase [Sclerotinia borealis F-4128]|uniref:Mannitol 1-phosphate dehydrogenase n=1 Tax=Sclerotinia borealis (strain F-4128) TaxID=1432307 RepID=W9CTU4_SCLBF|nr:mannitol 1-phosphate dehydrogenase [Sclerotinia borealis F-4128]
MAHFSLAQPATGEIEPLNIAIIGAGLTGLTFALSISALPPHARSHLRYTIYESHHNYSEIGAGIGFGASGHRIMKLLHPNFWENYKAIANWGDDDVWWDFVVGDRVGCAQEKNENGEEWEGRRIAQVRMKEGREGQSTAHRRSLMDILIKLLPPSCDVRFGKRLVGITSSSCSSNSQDSKVTLQFKDGTTAFADLVIGADGVKSICRDLVLTPTNNAAALKARFTGKIAYRGLIPMTAAKESIGAKARQRMFYLGHGGHVVTFPVEGGKSMNVVAFASREEGVWEGNWVRENVEEELGRDYLDGRWGRDVEEIMKLIQCPSYWATFYHPTAPTFHHPTLPILLIGDAAHTTAPHFGQGAGLGIEDVYILTTLLSHLPHPSPSPTSPSTIPTLSPSPQPQAPSLPIPIPLPLHLRALFTAYTQTRQPRATTAVSACNYYGHMLDMEDSIISDDIQKIEEEVRRIAETIWGYDEIGEGERGVRIMREVMEGKRETEENWASRPLCHTQASDRWISSWVGDHQRIPTVVCILFSAPAFVLPNRKQPATD